MTLPYMVIYFITLFIFEMGPRLLLDTNRKVPTAKLSDDLEKNDLDPIFRVFQGKLLKTFRK